MSPRPTLLCAVRGPAEVLVVQAAARAGVTVTRRCADLAELLAAAAAGLGRVAVVSADLAHLDREAVATLAADGVAVVGLVPPDAPGAGERLRALGVARLAPVPADAEAADAVVEVARLVGSGTGSGEGASGSSATPPARGGTMRGTAPGGVPGGDDLGGGDVGGAHLARGPVRTGLGFPPLGRSDSGAAGDGDGGAFSTSPATAPGRLVAVWGPTGAPGRTTVAVQLAAELALAGRSCLLVDADTYGGAVAQVIGLLDEAPGLAAAARAAGQGTLDPVALARWAPVVAPGWRVLAGISRPQRWPELPAASLDAVWPVARLLAEVVVVDCGFALEQDEALTYDTRAPQRNQATLSALAAADRVVVVGSGDPVGMQRLIRGLDDLAALGSSAGRTVVVNRVRAAASGPRPAQAVRAALARYAGVSEAVVVPDDPAALDASVLRAEPLHEVAPRSPARLALAALAASLVADDAPRPGSGTTPDGADGASRRATRRGRRRRGRERTAGRPA